MLAGYLVLLVGCLIGAVVFFGLRYVVAHAFGVRGLDTMLNLDPRPWANVSLGKRAVYVLAGPLGIYLYGAACVAAGVSLTGREVADETSMRVRVMHDGPAAQAGVIEGDTIVSVDGVPTRDWTALKAEIARHPGEPIELAITREGRGLVLRPTPGPNGKIGVGPPVERRPVPWASALGEGLSAAPRSWALSLKTLGGVFRERPEVQAVGPVGIVRETGRVVALGPGESLYLIGGMASYYLWIPTILALVLFPRARRRAPPAASPGP